MRLRFWLHRPSHYKTNLKQGAHIHQPTAWPVPHACAQPYHQGNGSHGQLFRPYWGSSACQESKCRKFKLTVSEVRVRVSCEAGLWKERGRTEARKARKGKEKEPPLLKVKPTPQDSINELIIQKKNPLKWCYTWRFATMIFSAAQGSECWNWIFSTSKLCNNNVVTLCY